MSKFQKKSIIVLSAIRFRNGGPLTLYENILNELDKSSLSKKNKIIAFVYDKNHFPIFKNIDLISFPKYLNNYLFRIIYGSFYTFFWSLTRDIDTWIDLHDFPSLHKSKKNWLYFHNPSIYLKNNINYLKYDKTQFLLIFLYPFLIFFFRPHIKNIIVQQEWLSRYFNHDKLFVHKPEINFECIPGFLNKINNISNKKILFYPALPRVFKGHDLIIDSLKMLNKGQIDKIKVIFTLDGSETGWARSLLIRSKELPIEFRGYLQMNEIREIYKNCDALVFPSDAETWGLPLSEAMSYKLPILVKKKPYIYGPLSGYDKVATFNNSEDLSVLIDKFINNDNIFDNIPDNYNGKKIINLFR